MRALRSLFVFIAVGVAAGVMIAPDPAEAGCRWFKASHNGTDLFYSDGAAGTAEWSVGGRTTSSLCNSLGECCLVFGC